MKMMKSIPKKRIPPTRDTKSQNEWIQNQTIIFIGGYQPPTRAKATYFFVPKTSQNVICEKTIPQTTLPSNAAGILSNRGGSLRMESLGIQV